MRRVRLLIEQQLRSRQAEAELLQWESTMNGIALRRQKGGERGMETPAADVAAKTALLTIERARDEGGEQTGADGDTVVAAITGETSVVPPVGIRGLRGVVSRTASLDGRADEDPERRHRLMPRGTLRGLLDGPRDAGDVGERSMQSCHFTLRGISTGQKLGAPSRKARVPSSLAGVPSATPGSKAEGAAAVTAEGAGEADDIIVQRLVGVPDHDRGLYAALRLHWKEARDTRAFARKLFGRRVRASAWWRIADSREGMLAAAQAIGLEPEVYETLMTRWMEKGKGTEWATGHAMLSQSMLSVDSAGNMTSPHHAPLPSAGVASLASLMFSGDEELSNMSVLAHQLGRLQMSGIVTPGEPARIIEGDEESIRNELTRLLGSDAAKQHAARLVASSSISVNEGPSESFHYLAKALLQERRRTAMAEKQHGDLGGVSERYKSCVDPKSRVSPMRRDSASQSSLDRFFPSIGSREQRNLFSFLSSGEKKPSLVSLMEEEREALGDSVTLEERQAFKEAAVAAAGGIGSADPYSRLPPLRGPNDGEAVLHRSRQGHAGSGASYSSGRRYTGGAGGDTATSSDIDPLDLTQAPGALGSTGSEKGGRGDAPSPSIAGGYTNGQQYEGPAMWKRRRRHTPGSRSGWTPAEDDEIGRLSRSHSTEGANRIDVYGFLREVKQQERGFRLASLEDSGHLSSEAGAQPSARSSLQWSPEYLDDVSVRDRPKRVTRFLYDGKANRSAGTHTGSSSGVRPRGRNIPPFVRKPKSKPAGQLLVVDDDGSEYDSGELSSLFANDDEDLTLFLATFPEELQHVRLRTEARGVLGELKETSSLLVNYATNVRHRLPEGYLSTAPHESLLSATAMAEAAEELKTKVRIEELRQRFELEGYEEHPELWRTLQDLRQKVLEQEAFLKESLMDVVNLSRPLPGEDRDAFAIRLTREVNEYAKSHRLDQRDLGKNTDIKDDYTAAVKGFLESFALTRGRRPGHDVGCQCNPDDLGYVDEEIRRTEEEMEDLYFHARGLFSAIKLTIVAVGNVMGFHASLELESTCKRCFYIFESPRTLWPCGHTFCQQCLPFIFTEQGELICEECGSLCEVGYTPNLALELVASYQAMQHTDYDDDDDDGGDGEISCVVQRRSIEEVLTAMLKDLMSTQTTMADAPRKTAGKAAPHPLELVM
ncbi:hypothetical protein BCY84_19748 [Trypanosoma cruzi cruzi]|nr:hypothetical protein BCY84_19748 [Trypanosoma cruzi cruzi]